MIKTIATAAFTALIVAVLFSGLVGSNYQPAVGGETRFPNSNVTVSGFTQGGGVQTITTTSGSYTLTSAELNESNVFEIASTLSPAFTLTLPSTTTLTSVIPRVGDFREWIIDNQHLAATTTTIVAGSGIDLIAVTANDDVIDGQEKSRLSCWRKADLTVACIVSELLAAD